MAPGPFRSLLEVHRGTRRGDSLNPVIGGSATLHLGVNLFPSTWSREVRIQSTTRVGTAMKFNDQRSSFQPWKWVQTRAFAGSLTYLPISTNSRTFRQNSVKFSRKRSSAYRAIFLLPQLSLSRIAQLSRSAGMGEIDHRENETQDPAAQRSALCGGYLFRKKITVTDNCILFNQWVDWTGEIKFNKGMCCYIAPNWCNYHFNYI
jgi:hypothetical protein